MGPFRAPPARCEFLSSHLVTSIFCCQVLSASFFLAILIGVWCYLTVAVICIFVIPNDGKHLFRGFAFRVCSLVICQLKFVYFFNCVVCFLTVNFENCLYILDTSPLLDM